MHIFFLFLNGKFQYLNICLASAGCWTSVNLHGMVSGVIHDDGAGTVKIWLQLLFYPFGEVCSVHLTMVITCGEGGFVNKLSPRNKSFLGTVVTIIRSCPLLHRSITPDVFGPCQHRLAQYAVSIHVLSTYKS